MKESFNIKLSNEVPPIQINGDDGVNSLAYSDSDKIEALINTFYQFPLLMTLMLHYPICIAYVITI